MTWPQNKNGKPIITFHCQGKLLFLLVIELKTQIPSGQTNVFVLAK